MKWCTLKPLKVGRPCTSLSKIFKALVYDNADSMSRTGLFFRFGAVFLLFGDGLDLLGYLRTPLLIRPVRGDIIEFFQCG